MRRLRFGAARGRSAIGATLRFDAFCFTCKLARHLTAYRLPALTPLEVVARKLRTQGTLLLGCFRDDSLHVHHPFERAETSRRYCSFFQNGRLKRHGAQGRDRTLAYPTESPPFFECQLSSVPTSRPGAFFAAGRVRLCAAIPKSSACHALYEKDDQHRLLCAIQIGLLIKVQSPRRGSTGCPLAFLMMAVSTQRALTPWGALMARSFIFHRAVLSRAVGVN